LASTVMVALLGAMVVLLRYDASQMSLVMPQAVRKPTTCDVDRVMSCIVTDLDMAVLWVTSQLWRRSQARE
jgi:hypothetical protein